MATAHAFNSRHATSSRVEAARPIPPAAPQPSIADRLASGDLYKITTDEARDLPYFKGPIIPDYALGVDYMLCRWTVFGRAFRVYLDTPLCSSCDTPCPDGICSECGA